MPATLTYARRQLWKALKSDAPLAAKFKRFFTFDKDAPHFGSGDVLQANQPQLWPPQPGVAQLPAIAIYPVAQGADEWATNRGKHRAYPLTVYVWTPHADLAQPEALMEELRGCFWRAKDTGAGGTNLEFWRGDPNNDKAIQRVEVAPGFKFTPVALEAGTNEAAPPNATLVAFDVTLHLGDDPSAG